MNDQRFWKEGLQILMFLENPHMITSENHFIFNF
jgi:hypothetical protein